jgi:hypothetical protein
MALEQFNPFALIQGFEFGQRSQREEEKSLADIETRNLQNEILGERAAEYTSPEFRQTRQAENQLASLLAQLGVTTTGFNIESAQQSGPEIVAGLNARAAAARRGAELQREQVGLAQELFPQQAAQRRKVVQQDTELMDDILGTRAQRAKAERAQVDQTLRALNTELVDSGARDLFDKQVSANPDADPYENATRAIESSTNPRQRAALIRQRSIIDAAQLSKAATPDELNLLARRPGRPMQSRVAQTPDGKWGVFPVVSTRTDETGQLVETFGKGVMVENFEEARQVLVGQYARPQAQARVGTQKPTPASAGADVSAARGAVVTPRTTPPVVAPRSPVVAPRRPVAAPQQVDQDLLGDLIRMADPNLTGVPR